MRLRQIYVSPFQMWAMRTILLDLRNYAYRFELSLFHEKEFGTRTSDVGTSVEKLIKHGYILKDKTTNRNKPFYKVTEDGIKYLEKNKNKIDRQIEIYSRTKLLLKKYQGAVCYDQKKEIFTISISFRRPTFQNLIGEAHKTHFDIVTYCQDAVLIGAGLKDVGDVSNVEKNEESKIEPIEPSFSE